MKLSVIVSTHNPNSGRFGRALAALRAQTLPSSNWDAIVVDNASSPSVSSASFGDAWPSNGRIVREGTLGLTAARRRGFAEAKGNVVVMVDDDNELEAGYLEQAIAILAARPRMGAMGGKSHGVFESHVPLWAREFDGLLACRDLGEIEKSGSWAPGGGERAGEYFDWAPLGAGMVLRREAAQAWLDESGSEGPTDRRGTELSSGGDNDIVFSVLKAGWEIGYFPRLALAHLIPPSRTTRAHLARLNFGIAYSWIQVLRKHGACPWAPIPRWTVPLRQVKAWFAYRAWSGPAAFVRWQGACGHFAARARNPR